MARAFIHSLGHASGPATAAELLEHPHPAASAKGLATYSLRDGDPGAPLTRTPLRNHRATGPHHARKPSSRPDAAGPAAGRALRARALPAGRLRRQAQALPQHAARRLPPPGGPPQHRPAPPVPPPHQVSPIQAAPVRRRAAPVRPCPARKPRLRLALAPRAVPRRRPERRRQYRARRQGCAHGEARLRPRQRTLPGPAQRPLRWALLLTLPPRLRGRA